MKLIHPQTMSEQQEKVLQVCLSDCGDVPGRDVVLDAIATQSRTLEGDLTIADRGFPVPRAGRIDLLAVDGKSHPVLVFVEDRLEATGLCRSLLCAAWVEEHREVIEHIAPGGHIRSGVRVWHCVSEVDSQAQAILARLMPPLPEIFLVHAVTLAEGQWLVARKQHRDTLRTAGDCSNMPVGQAAMPEDHGERQRDEAMPRASLRLNSLLTDEEVDAFFAAPGGRAEAEDEITSSLKAF